MNRWKFAGLLCFLAGVFSLLLHFNTGHTGQHTGLNDRKINLALRQAAHDLYKAQGDATSTIPPVEQVLSSSTYVLQLDRFINYDTLPILLDRAFSNFQISNAYEVAIKSCQGDTILLGYNLLAFENRNIPCLGRDQAMACNLLEVSFEEVSQQSKHVFMLLAILCLLGGLLCWLKQAALPPTPQSAVPVAPPTSNTLQIGRAVFDPKNLTIQFQDEQRQLTFREAKLLEYLAKHPNEILKREQIQDHVWKEEGAIVGRSLDVFISRLRKILKAEPNISIKNIHGVGYRLEVD